MMSRKDVAPLTSWHMHASELSSMYSIPPLITWKCRGGPRCSGWTVATCSTDRGALPEGCLLATHRPLLPLIMNSHRTRTAQPRCEQSWRANKAVFLRDGCALPFYSGSQWRALFLPKIRWAMSGDVGSYSWEGTLQVSSGKWTETLLTTL